MNYLGDFPAGGVVICAFNTTNSEGSYEHPTVNGLVDIMRLENNGESAEMGGLPVHHGLGYNSASHKTIIDTSVSPGFFLPGYDYAIKYYGATIDGVANCIAILGQFSIENRSAYLRPNGLDDIAVTEPAGDPANWSFVQKLLWLVMRFLNSHSSDNFNGIRVKKSDDTLSTTQAVTEAAGVKTVEKAV